MIIRVFYTSDDIWQKDKLKKQGKYTGGKVRKGYDLGDNGQLVICEKEQKEINLVKSLRAKGSKYKDIK